MHLKVFVKLKKALKTLSSGQKNPKKPKKKQKIPKKQKNPKKLTGLGFFKITRVFSNPGRKRSISLVTDLDQGEPNQCK
jgi:hypothetical protein